jgi:TolA-binding protein
MPGKFSIMRSGFCAAALTAFLVAMMPTAAHAQESGEQAGDDTSAGIEERLRRIEDTIIDMRAMIGALQSFAPEDSTMPADSPEDDPAGDPFAETAGDEEPSAETMPSAPPAADVKSLEIQVQALAAQLSETIKRLGRVEKAVGITPDESSAADDQSSPAADRRSTDDDVSESRTGATASGFGTTTVERPDRTDGDVSPDAEPRETVTAEADSAGSEAARQLYIQAYDALQAKEYQAARSSFQSFIEEHPDDPLANDARYWMADAAFAMGDYLFAANNLVKVYNAAPTGEKSEQTLLKLAIALRRMDRPESACDALSRLEGRLDGMPEGFRERVESERRRSAC